MLNRISNNGTHIQVVSDILTDDVIEVNKCQSLIKIIVNMAKYHYITYFVNYLPLVKFPYSIMYRYIVNLVCNYVRYLCLCS